MVKFKFVFLSVTTSKKGLWSTGSGYTVPFPRVERVKSRVSSSNARRRMHAELLLGIEVIFCSVCVLNVQIDNRAIT
jgi:hypothetical protein